MVNQIKINPTLINSDSTHLKNLIEFFKCLDHKIYYALHGEKHTLRKISLNNVSRYYIISNCFNRNGGFSDILKLEGVIQYEDEKLYLKNLKFRAIKTPKEENKSVTSLSNWINESFLLSNFPVAFLSADNKDTLKLLVLPIQIFHSGSE